MRLLFWQDTHRAIVGYICYPKRRSGNRNASTLALVEWADHAEVTIDWQFVRSSQDAHGLAQRIRSLKHQRGDYTCLARMLAIVGEKVLGTLPAPVARRVVDVSGDGIDNCDDADASNAARDALVSQGVTINGLPILVRGENDIVGAGGYRAPGYGLRQRRWGPDSATTLDAWYNHHVVAGPGAFLHVARGYEDFGRAFRQKFVTEISAWQCDTSHACSNDASDAVRNSGAVLAPLGPRAAVPVSIEKFGERLSSTSIFRRTARKRAQRVTILIMDLPALGKRVLAAPSLRGMTVAQSAGATRRALRTHSSACAYRCGRGESKRR